MRSIVRVTTTRTDESRLVTLDELKDELQITTSDTDDYLGRLLIRASQSAEKHCNRVFAVETLAETLRPEPGRRMGNSLLLARSPVTAIASITLDGVALSTDLFDPDEQSGIVYRLDTAGNLGCWEFGKAEIAYTAGYATVPGPVQQAVFEMVKQHQAARTRDPSLKSENILEGLYSYSLFSPTDTVDGLPPAVADLLSRYVRLSI